MRIMTTILILITSLFSCGKIEIKPFIETPKEQKSSLPKSNSGDTIYYRDGYCFSYSEKYEQPKWVFYTLKSEDIICNNQASRKDNFREDGGVKTGSASLEDYKGSGYDRGHLKASADESCNQTQMDETFLMSNMSPQKPSFNRGIWKNLESYVRDLVVDYDSIQVITSGNLNDNLVRIGPNKVGVPKYYYKVLYKYKNGVKSIECFYLPNEKNSDFNVFKVSIDVLEDSVGIKFQ